MEFNIDKRILTEAIKKVSKAISSKAAIPVLSGIHLVADESGLMLTGSDSDLSIRTFITNDKMDGAEIIQNGSIVLPAKEFAGIARSMPSDIISVTSIGVTQVNISSGKSKFVLNGMDGNEYPKLPKVDGESFIIKGSTLKSLIEKTSYAVANSEVRPILTGINLFIENDKLGMVATDSHRLSRVVGDEIQSIPLTENITLPGKTLKELSSIIGDTEEILIKESASQIVFQSDKLYVMSRLLQGQYPPTERLIPVDHKTRLTVDRKSFLSSIERSAILTDGDKKVVTLTIAEQNNGIFETIELSHRSSELGQSKEEIIVEGIEGDELTISFNPTFMIEALKRIDDEKVVIEFSGSMRPFILKPSDGGNFTQLILPVRTYS